MSLARSVLCWMIVLLVPAALMGADSGAAIARPYGPAWLNGIGVQQSAAIFPGDLVQTSSSAALKIRASGSSVTVLSDSVVKFEGTAVSVEHGSVQMMTSQGMVARAGIVTATPASSGWTEFELNRTDGEVRILALKGDLQINDGSQTTTLAQGQQTTQKDSAEAQEKPAQPGAVPPAKKRKKKAAIIAVAVGGSAAVIASAVAVSLSGANSPRVISPITP